MQEEMNSLWKNDTYELTKLPKGRKELKNKGVFKLKNDDEKVLKYKARLMMKGFGQKQGIDFVSTPFPARPDWQIRTESGLLAEFIYQNIYKNKITV